MRTGSLVEQTITSRAHGLASSMGRRVVRSATATRERTTRTMAVRLGAATATQTPTSDPAQIGTLIPGVERLVAGIYDAGGDPSVAFDSQGNVYYAGLGFNRT